MRVRYLIFSYNRELLHFIVKENKEVFYTDKKFKIWIRILPPPKDLMLKIAQSRNRVPSFIANLFKYTDEELKEYEMARDEKDLAKIVTRDALLKGCILIKDEEIKDEDPKWQI